MTITLTHEEAQQVLDALEKYVCVVVSVNDPNSWTTKVSDGGKPARKAIETLRTRLEQPQPFQVLPHDFSRAVEQQVLAVLEWNLPLIEDFGDKEQLHEQHKAIETLRAKLSAHEPYKQPEDNRLLMQAYRAIHEKQPEPEPVAKMREMLEVQGRDGTWNYSPYLRGMYNGMEFMLALVEDREPVYRDEPDKYYTTPPQREWQGLTDEEIKQARDIVDGEYKMPNAWARAIEAKLRERNT